MGALLAGKRRQRKPQPDDGIAADCPLPFDHAGKLADYFVGDAVDAAAFVDNAIGDAA